MKAFDLPLQNILTSALPADPITDNYRRQVEQAVYSFVSPTPCSKASLVAYADELAAELGLDFTADQLQAWADVLSGNSIQAGWKPYALCYGGHQFGHWAGQLGDGRAINLGEYRSPAGIVTLQLKGAGPTPYSRSADGLAVLRSSIREFLCSEAVSFLGIPTTRALSVVQTGDQVLRDMMYDGNAAYEPGAVVCRVAPSFLRFGNFEILAARQDHVTLKLLADFTLRQYFPHLGEPGKEAYLQMLAEIADKTLDMVVHWLRVGFVHGVMNTDNMSVLGLTIDYGPYGWLEAYDEDWTPNTTDKEGKRYAFGQQANICLWNLWKLANALYPLIEETEGLQAILSDFPLKYKKNYLAMMRSKLGLSTSQDDDVFQIRRLLDLMERDRIDYTLFFRTLSQINASNFGAQTWEILIKETSYLGAEILAPKLQDWHSWLEWYTERLQAEGSIDEERTLAMNAVNPRFILRNYMVQLAIEAAEKGDYSKVESLYQLSKTPYKVQDGDDAWIVKSPDWAFEKPGCSMLSCSS
ncbi:MAG TPA: YdiU family protein [Saprospiraceae bacterium]|nr:YdiU family protein [Saprospiraceae bacterium]